MRCIREMFQRMRIESATKKSSFNIIGSVCNKIARMGSLAALVIALFVSGPATTHAVQLGHLKTLKHVELTENTRIDLDVLPDLGVRLIFPFKLSDAALDPPFFYKITNNQVFKVPNSKELEDQNSLIVSVAPPSGIKPGNASNYISTLYLSAGGYNVTINMRLTLNAKRHTSDLVFDISPKERKHLIDRVVSQRLKHIEADYQKKLADLNQRAKSHALKYLHIVTQQPKIEMYRQEKMTILPQGERLDLYVEMLRQYSDGFYVMTYEVINKSPRDMLLHRHTLQGISNGQRKPIQGHVHCGKRVPADEEIPCAFITQDATIVWAEELEFTVTSDRGEASIIW